MALTSPNFYKFYKFVMNNILRLIRPQQWLKNVFVLLPMFFGGSLLDAGDILASLLTFVAYSFVASSVYCFNDINDLEADRRHPVKRHRPIASGALSVRCSPSQPSPRPSSATGTP